MTITHNSTYEDIRQSVDELQTRYETMTKENLDNPERKDLLNEMADIAAVVLNRLHIVDILPHEVGLKVEEDTIVVEYYEDIVGQHTDRQKTIRTRIAVFPGWNFLAVEDKPFA